MNIFNYIIQLGASVMMPVIFTIIGLCIGMKFGKALKSDLYVGVGFVGLGIVTALLTDNFKDPLQAIEDIFSLNLSVFDMGWPAAASVAYNTAVGALIIPICLGINFLMIVTKTTRTVNIDLWNYWHFAFIGAVVYFVFDESLLWGYFAAIVCYILTLVMADFTKAAAAVYQQTQDKAAHVPDGFMAGSMDFASSLIGYCIYALCKYAKYVGAIALATFTAVMVVVNHKRITKAEKQERVTNLETA
jgi:PTS system galactitol-specific IIC component